MSLLAEEQYSYNRYMEYLSYKASEMFTLKTEAEYKIIEEIAIKSIKKGMDNQLVADITGLNIAQIIEIRTSIDG